MFTLTETLREVGQSWSPGWNFTHVALGATASKAGTAMPSAAPVLSGVLESFLTDGRIVGDYANEHRAIVRHVGLIVGDRPVTSYGKDDARRVKDVLSALPANWMKPPSLRNLPITQAAEKARELGYQPQKPKTINFKRAMLSAIFDYADAHYEGVTNPFKNTKLWPKIEESAVENKPAFSAEELSKLLASDLPKELYWLTWIGLLSGARLNEICQLTTELVEPTRFYFAPCLRLKTAKRGGSSVRSVPLHPKLVELGLLEFAQKAKGKLFPNIPMHRSGKFSDAPSKSFRRHLDDIGLKRPKLSFHSLRHTFAAEFRREAPTDVETRERLMGHHVAGVAGRYGDDYVAEANDKRLLATRTLVVAKLFPNI
ncbi:MAG: site-specific integrase [Proteobacteria bacterium]|nr:site-specific integrase [Pseudomonadota bacterium]